MILRVAFMILLLLPALLPALPAAAQENRPEFARIIRMPSRGDRFQRPVAVHADRHAGELFICDKYGHRILVFDERGLFQFEIRGGKSFQAPEDVAVDPEGILYLLGRHGGARRIVKIDFDGRYLDSFGLRNLPEGAAEPLPVSLALSRDGGTLYVLDQANIRLWIAANDGTVRGSVDLAAGLPDDRAFEQMLGRVDSYGDTVLVALPMAGSVNLYEPDGTPRGAVGIKGTSFCESAFPVAGAMDSRGNVVLLDKQRTLGMIWRPSDNKCLMEFSSIGTSPGALYQPSDLTLDSRGRVFISQGYEGRVQMYEGFTPAPPGEATGD